MAGSPGSVQKSIESQKGREAFFNLCELLAVRAEVMVKPWNQEGRDYQKSLMAEAGILAETLLKRTLEEADFASEGALVELVKSLVEAGCNQYFGEEWIKGHYDFTTHAQPLRMVLAMLNVWREDATSNGKKANRAPFASPNKLVQQTTSFRQPKDDEQKALEKHIHVARNFNKQRDVYSKLTENSRLENFRAWRKGLSENELDKSNGKRNSTVTGERNQNVNSAKTIMPDMSHAVSEEWLSKLEQDLNWLYKNSNSKIKGEVGRAQAAVLKYKEALINKNDLREAIMGLSVPLEGEVAEANLEQAKKIQEAFKAYDENHADLTERNSSYLELQKELEKAPANAAAMIRPAIEALKNIYNVIESTVPDEQISQDQRDQHSKELQQCAKTFRSEINTDIEQWIESQQASLGENTALNQPAILGLNALEKKAKKSQISNGSDPTISPRPTSFMDDVALEIPSPPAPKPSSAPPVPFVEAVTQNLIAVRKNVAERLTPSRKPSTTPSPHTPLAQRKLDMTNNVGENSKGRKQSVIRKDLLDVIQADFTKYCNALKGDRNTQKVYDYETSFKSLSANLTALKESSPEEIENIEQLEGAIHLIHFENSTSKDNNYIKELAEEVTTALSSLLSTTTPSLTEESNYINLEKHESGKESRDLPESFAMPSQKEATDEEKIDAFFDLISKFLEEGPAILEGENKKFILATANILQPISNSDVALQKSFFTFIWNLVNNKANDYFDKRVLNFKEHGFIVAEIPEIFKKWAPSGNKIILTDIAGMKSARIKLEEIRIAVLSRYKQSTEKKTVSVLTKTEQTSALGSSPSVDRKSSLPTRFTLPAADDAMTPGREEEKTELKPKEADDDLQAPSLSNEGASTAKPEIKSETVQFRQALSARQDLLASIQSNFKKLCEAAKGSDTWNESYRDLNVKLTELKGNADNNMLEIAYIQSIESLERNVNTIYTADDNWKRNHLKTFKQLADGLINAIKSYDDDAVVSTDGPEKVDVGSDDENQKDTGMSDPRALEIVEEGAESLEQISDVFSTQLQEKRDPSILEMVGNVFKNLFSQQKPARLQRFEEVEEDEDDNDDISLNQNVSSDVSSELSPLLQKTEQVPANKEITLETLFQADKNQRYTQIFGENFDPDSLSSHEKDNTNVNSDDLQAKQEPTIGIESSPVISSDLISTQGTGSSVDSEEEKLQKALKYSDPTASGDLSLSMPSSVPSISTESKKPYPDSNLELEDDLSLSLAQKKEEIIKEEVNISLSDHLKGTQKKSTDNVKEIDKNVGAEINDVYAAVEIAKRAVDFAREARETAQAILTIADGHIEELNQKVIELERAETRLQIKLQKIESTPMRVNAAKMAIAEAREALTKEIENLMDKKAEAAHEEYNLSFDKWAPEQIKKETEKRNILEKAENSELILDSASPKIELPLTEPLMGMIVGNENEDSSSSDKERGKEKEKEELTHPQVSSFRNALLEARIKEAEDLVANAKLSGLDLSGLSNLVDEAEAAPPADDATQTERAKVLAKALENAEESLELRKEVIKSTADWLKGLADEDNKKEGSSLLRLYDSLLASKGDAYKNQMPIQKMRTKQEVLNGIELDIVESLNLIDGLVGIGGIDLGEARLAAATARIRLAAAKPQLEQERAKIARELVDAVSAETSAAEGFIINDLQKKLQEAIEADDPIDVLTTLKEGLDLRIETFARCINDANEVRADDAPEDKSMKATQASNLVAARVAMDKILAVKFIIEAEQKVISAQSTVERVNHAELKEVLSLVDCAQSDLNLAKQRINTVREQIRNEMQLSESVIDELEKKADEIQRNIDAAKLKEKAAIAAVRTEIREIKQVAEMAQKAVTAADKAINKAVEAKKPQAVISAAIAHEGLLNIQLRALKKASKRLNEIPNGTLEQERETAAQAINAAIHEVEKTQEKIAAMRKAVADELELNLGPVVMADEVEGELRVRLDAANKESQAERQPVEVLGEKEKEKEKEEDKPLVLPYSDSPFDYSNPPTSEGRDDPLVNIASTSSPIVVPYSSPALSVSSTTTNKKKDETVKEKAIVRRPDDSKDIHEKSTEPKTVDYPQRKAVYATAIAAGDVVIFARQAIDQAQAAGPQAVLKIVDVQIEALKQQVAELEKKAAEFEAIVENLEENNRRLIIDAAREQIQKSKAAVNQEIEKLTSAKAAAYDQLSSDMGADVQTPDSNLTSPLVIRARSQNGAQPQRETSKKTVTFKLNEEKAPSVELNAGVSLGTEVNSKPSLNGAQPLLFVTPRPPQAARQDQLRVPKGNVGKQPSYSPNPPVATPPAQQSLSGIPGTEETLVHRRLNPVEGPAELNALNAAAVASGAQPPVNSVPPPAQQPGQQVGDQPLIIPQPSRPPVTLPAAGGMHAAEIEDDGDAAVDAIGTGLWAKMQDIFHNKPRYMADNKLSYTSSNDNSGSLCSKLRVEDKNGDNVPEFKIKLDHDPATGVVRAKCSGPNGFPEGFKQMLAVYAEAGAKTINITINKKTGESDDQKQGREYMALCAALSYGMVPTLKRENSLYESLEFFKRQERISIQRSPQAQAQDANDPKKYGNTRAYIHMIVENEESFERLLEEMPPGFNETEFRALPDDPKRVDYLLSYVVTGKPPAAQKQQEQKVKVEVHPTDNPRPKGWFRGQSNVGASKHGDQSQGGSTKKETPIRQSHIPIDDTTPNYRR